MVPTSLTPWVLPEQPDHVQLKKLVFHIGSTLYIPSTEVIKTITYEQSHNLILIQFNTILLFDKFLLIFLIGSVLFSLQLS